jgi:hypothetical protein
MSHTSESYLSINKADGDLRRTNGAIIPSAGETKEDDQTFFFILIDLEVRKMMMSVIKHI